MNAASSVVPLPMPVDDARELGAAEPLAGTRAFEEFYGTHIDAVYRALAVTLGDVDLATEAADEAMTRAYERWATVAGAANPAGWVYRVGLNWATSRWRKRRRETLFGRPPDVVAAPSGADPAALTALERVPVEQRAVVVCRALLQMSTRETAEALGLPEGTVKSRMARGLAALRERLDEGDGA